MPNLAAVSGDTADPETTIVLATHVWTTALLRINSRTGKASGGRIGGAELSIHCRMDLGRQNVIRIVKIFVVVNGVSVEGTRSTVDAHSVSIIEVKNKFSDNWIK